MKSSPALITIAMISALGLAMACPAARAQDAAAPSPADAASAASSFRACIDFLRRERPQHPEVRADTFEQYTRSPVDLRPVIQAASESQPEFKLAIWDYVAKLVDAQRIEQGKQILAAQATPLRAIAARRGVDAATAVAVFGVETDYGRVGGRYQVVDATLSRACLDLKSKERKRHFYSALWLLQEGLVQQDAFRGSWAGAFGLTQFMPGTFVTFMDDGDGSGAVDIIGSAPDALATTANYIASLGWTDGVRWGVEVTLPKGAGSGLAGGLVSAEREHACLSGNGASDKCRTVDQWIALGVTAVGGQGGSGSGMAGLPSGTRTALLAPGGIDGPAWLVTRNYQAIWGYNRADAYALSIGLLSDALRGEPPMRTPWPTDDIGLSRAQLRELQQMLIDRGHADVVADGYDGPRTREAIRAEERQLGWAESGRAGARVAQAMARAKREGAVVDGAPKQGALPQDAGASQLPAVAPQPPATAVPPQPAASDVTSDGVQPVPPVPQKAGPDQQVPSPQPSASQPTEAPPSAPQPSAPQPSEPAAPNQAPASSAPS